MKYFSTFTGIGGFEIAIESEIKSAKCVGFSEIDKYAIQTYVKNFPAHAELNIGDIERFVFDLDKDGDYVVNVARVKMLPDFDLLVGGSPCQDLSIARAKRQGLAGQKSRLFFAYAEILSIKKPKYFILENVASMSKEARATMTVAIKECGYDVEAIEINAALVSGQKRRRLFWTNIPVEQPDDLGIQFKDVLENIETNEFDLSQKEIDYMNKTVKGGRTHWDFLHHHDSKDSKDSKSKTLVSNLSKGVPYNVLIDRRIHGLGWSKSTRDWGVESRYTNDGKANTITTGDGGASQSSRNMVIQENGDKSIIRKLTPIECERLQSMPDNWTQGVSKTQRYKQSGNAVNVNVIKHILRGIK